MRFTVPPPNGKGQPKRDKNTQTLDFALFKHTRSEFITALLDAHGIPGMYVPSEDGPKFIIWTG